MPPLDAPLLVIAAATEIDQPSATRDAALGAWAPDCGYHQIATPKPWALHDFSQRLMTVDEKVRTERCFAVQPSINVAIGAVDPDFEHAHQTLFRLSLGWVDSGDAGRPWFSGRDDDRLHRQLPCVAKTSAGLLPYRYHRELEVFLVHPGGPFWAAKDDGAWSIPKGEFEVGEDPLAAAKREFTEETGFVAEGEFIALTPLKQKSGKVVHGWAVQMDCDPAAVQSNTFTLRGRTYPEIDRAAWFGLDAARRKILPGQLGFLNELEELMA